MKTYSSYKKLRIYKLTKQELDFLIEEITRSFNGSKSVKLKLSSTIKQVSITEETQELFWSHTETLSPFSDLTIYISDYESDKSVRLVFSGQTTSLSVNSKDQIWVNGIERQIVNFLSDKKSYLGFVNSELRFALQGGLGGWAIIGFLFLVFNATQKGDYASNAPLWFSVFLLGMVSYILGLAKNRFDKDKSSRWNRGEILAVGGIVVGIAGILVPYITSHITKDIPNAASDVGQLHATGTQMLNDGNRLSPDRILQSINREPILQRESIANNYKGVSVSWRVSVFGVDNDRTMMAYDGDSPYIVCGIGTGAYPQIKLLNNKDIILVQGIIESISESKFYLNNCKFIF